MSYAESAAAIWQAMKPTSPPVMVLHFFTLFPLLLISQGLPSQSHLSYAEGGAAFQVWPAAQCRAADCLQCGLAGPPAGQVQLCIPLLSGQPTLTSFLLPLPCFAVVTLLAKVGLILQGGQQCLHLTLIQQQLFAAAEQCKQQGQPQQEQQ